MEVRVRVWAKLRRKVLRLVFSSRKALHKLGLPLPPKIVVALPPAPLRVSGEDFHSRLRFGVRR